MGKDIIPSKVSNKTTDLTLVVVNGDQWGDFHSVAAGESSTKHVRSIDAFGAYKTGNVEQPVTLYGYVWNGPTSSWWKTPDGTTCSVYKEDGKYYMKEAHVVPLKGPSTSAAKDWEYPPSP